MSQPGSKDAVDGDANNTHPNTAPQKEDSRHDSAAVTPKLNAISKPEFLALNRSRTFLSAPLTGPIRPLSPDTLSNLSIDEYQQIHPTRRPSHTAPLTQSRSHSPAPPRGIRGRLQQSWARNKGLAYMLLGQVFGTLMNVTTRLLEVEGNKGKGLHPFQILFARMGITFVLASSYMWWTKTPHFPLGQKDVRLLLVGRAFGGFGGVFGMYYSLLYLGLADATVITFLAPSLACWACSILINEPFTRVEKFGALISFIGVILIARPTFIFTAILGGDSGSDTPPGFGTPDAITTPTNTTTPSPDASNYDNVTPIQRLTAVGIALIGVLGSATAYTTIRWIGKRAHPLISVNYFSGAAFLVSVLMQAVLPGVGFLLPADAKEWGYLIFLGTCGFVMQFLLAAGLAHEKSSRATNMVYTQMLFALGFDKLIFGHTPGVMSILGSSLILGSAIVVAVQKDPNRNKSKDSTRTDGQDVADEEQRTGLMSDVEESEDHDRIHEEVELRSLR